jgi:Xaa-Pro aminopeptidase
MSGHLDLVREAMETTGVDVALFTSPPDIAYASGFNFTPFEHIAALAVPLEGNARLLLPGYEEAGVARAVPDEVILHMFPEIGSDADAFRDFIKGIASYDRIGVAKETISVDHYERFRAALGRSDMPDISEMISVRRSVKDEEELALIAEASRVADLTVARMLEDHVRPGVLEAQMGGEIYRIMRYEGADGTAFEPGITSGWRSALPHGPDHSSEAGASTDDYTIEAGDLFIFDFSVIVGGYATDISRTFVMGESEPRQREIFEVVREAQQEAFSKCRPGFTAGDVDRVAKQVIADAGYEEQSPQKTGHGLGIDLHELPFVGSSSEQPLEPGMVFAVEPAVYIAGYGGARVEDVVVITEDEPKLLTDVDAQANLELEIE